MTISMTVSGSVLRSQINKTIIYTIPFLFWMLSASILTYAGGNLASVPERHGLDISEIRGGLFAHNVEDNSSTEDGVDLNVEVLFTKLPFRHENKLINHFLTPKPHMGGHINTSDSTNMFYFGLTWNYLLTDTIFFESSFGGAIHDGALNTPGTLSFGCSTNFRESASLGWQMSEQLSVIVTVDHMSNANLCDRNGGLTNAGVRMGYKLN